MNLPPATPDGRAAAREVLAALGTVVSVVAVMVVVAWFNPPVEFVALVALVLLAIICLLGVAWLVWEAFLAPMQSDE